MKVADLVKSIRTLNEIAQNRRVWRHKNGSVSFNNREKKRFTMNEKGNNPIDWRWEERHESNFMVEEFMLLANILTGEILVKAFPKHALLRNHPMPSLKTAEFT